jgi:hypothetical protein
MIVAREISINQHFGSGARRDFIRVSFTNQSFPTSENRFLNEHLNALKVNEGHIDFLCLTDGEEPPLTDDGLFLCASGEISINSTTPSAFSYYQLPLEKNAWESMRGDAMSSLDKNLLIYFHNIYGRVVDSSDDAFKSLKVKLSFEKIVWARTMKSTPREDAPQTQN